MYQTKKQAQTALNLWLSTHEGWTGSVYPTGQGYNWHVWLLDLPDFIYKNEEVV